MSLVVEGLRIATGDLELVHGVSLSVAPGKVLGIVGESGSGKSLTTLSAPRLLPPGVEIAGGSIRFEDRELTAATEAEMRRLRGGGIGVVFQDPFKALNPVRRVGDLIAESVVRHQGLAAGAAFARAVEALAEVGIPEPERRARAFPHQMSGGQRQRVMIALALVNGPRLLIADEPTSALDPTVQVQILDLIRRASAKAGVLFVTHDLGAAAYLCDEIAVMQAGEIVEQGPAGRIIRAPAHAYTRALLDCIPSLGVVA
jgi:ABC-type dipeptide/oligopeptide/nickel transport system ATPase component